MKISIIMRSCNDIDYIEDTLKQLFNQTIKNFELINLDNESEDGTLEVIKKYNKKGRIFQIPKGKYVPGPVLNYGVSKSKGDIIVFLNADATPVDKYWLEELIKPLENEKVGAVYGRQVARKDARVIVRKDYLSAFPQGHKRKVSKHSDNSWKNLFSMASSATKKKIIDEIKIPEEVQYSEDIAWANELRKKYDVVYAPESRAYHSHNYTKKQTWKRFYNEGKADSQIFGKRKQSFLVVLYTILKSIVGDTLFMIKSRSLRLKEINYSIQTRINQKYGRYKGEKNTSY